MDGYINKSIKDMTHKMPSKEIQTNTITFTENMPFFLMHQNNQRFVELPVRKLYESNIEAMQSEDDADVDMSDSC